MIWQIQYRKAGCEEWHDAERCTTTDTTGDYVADGWALYNAHRFPGYPDAEYRAVEVKE